MADKIEDAFDEHFTELHDNNGFNGVVVIAKNGKITYKKAFGIADIENETPLKTSSIFNLASVSKQFTALCIMLLEEKGKLSYKDAITEYLTELPYNNVTIEHLLHHTSGLVAYEEIAEEYWEGDTEEDFITNKDLLKIYAENELELESEPGEKYEYSNTGYAFLASIVEHVSGVSFAKFIQKNIFEPLGMENSFSFCRPNKPPKKVVQGFQMNDEDEMEDYSYNFFDGIVGDGNVFCSAEDLVIYANALINGELVSKKTLKKAFTSGKIADGEETSYGFGWETESETFVSHTGCWEAYNTYLGLDLENNYVFVVLDSGDNGDIHDTIDEAMEEFYA